jgi:hypothetical protein
MFGNKEEWGFGDIVGAVIVFFLACSVVYLCEAYNYRM